MHSLFLCRLQANCKIPAVQSGFRLVHLTIQQTNKVINRVVNVMSQFVVIYCGGESADCRNFVVLQQFVRMISQNMLFLF